MGEISTSRIAAFFAAGDRARTAAERGRALEDLIAYLFGLIPGISETARNELNAFAAEEIDVAFWNDEHPDGLRQFDKLILVECKNWSSPAGPAELAVFQQKLASRGRHFGIFVAAAGITGDPARLTSAHAVLAQALQQNREIIVLTRSEIEELSDTAQLVRLLKRKRAQLAVSGTIFRPGGSGKDPAGAGRKGGPVQQETADAGRVPGLFVHADAVTGQEAGAFEQALAAAPDEAAMQRFLESSPHLLVQHLGAAAGHWVLPKKRLGTQHETDFLIAEEASAGLTWYAVELERPQARLFTAKGDPSAALTHALRQISDWRSWLSRNRDYATRPAGQAGLGLAGIDPELDGLIIMGRDPVDPRNGDRWRRLCREHRVRIETYDWLGRQARNRLAALRRIRDADSAGQAARDPVAGLFARREDPLQDAVRAVFGPTASSCVNVSAVRTVDVESVVLEPGDDPDEWLYVPVSIVRARSRPLSAADWKDWTSHTRDELGEQFSLLVTESPPDAGLQRLLTAECPGVWFQGGWYQAGENGPGPSGWADVLACVPPSLSADDRTARLMMAREVLLSCMPQADRIRLRGAHRPGR